MNKVKLFQISLNRGERTKLSAAHANELFFQCREGSAWLTAAADPQDYIVDPGQEVHLTQKSSDIVVESLSEHLEIDVYKCA